MRGLLVLHYHVVSEVAAAEGVEVAAESVRKALQSVRERMRPKQQ
jgi:translation initiation factor IF-2